MTPEETNERRLSDLRLFTSMLRNKTPFAAVKFNDGEWHAINGRKGSNCDNHPYSPALQAGMIAAYQSLNGTAYISDYATNHCAFPEIAKSAARLGNPIKQFTLFAMLHDLPHAGIYSSLTPELKAFYQAIRDDDRTKVFIGPKRLKPEQFLNLDQRIDVPMINAFASIKPVIDRAKAIASSLPGSIYLLTCGFCSCLLADDILKADPTATVLDLGSALDPLLFGKTRKSQEPTALLREFYSDFGCQWPPMTHYYDEIQGWFNFPDLYGDMVRRFDGGQFVEVGSWMGKSAAYLAVEIANSGKPITLDCVDHFKGSSAERDTHHKAAKRSNIKGICANNLRPFWATASNRNCEHRTDNMLRLVVDGSVAAAKRYKDKSLAFCFLDAGHTEKEVEADIKAWLPKVRRGGVLAGHDYSSKSFPGVQKAVDRLLPKRRRVSKNCWMVDM